MKLALKPWREASSLILVSKTTFVPHITQTDYNYKLLSIKRASKSSFMPDSYVFPGGAISQADKNHEWLKLYEKFGFNFEAFNKLDVKKSRPAIFNESDPNCIPKYISLRIGAIRETFEECGILICRSFKINYKERSARWASFIGGPEIKQWQLKVHKNPEQFIEFCQLFEIYPDIWALKEWSNWVTPPSFPIKFDTVFFITASHQIPAGCAEKHEVQHLQWDTPRDLINSNRKGCVWLPPPQYYEISRIGTFHDIDKLSLFANERSEHGLERYLPRRIVSEGVSYSIYPGDDMYEVPDLDNTEEPEIGPLPNVHVRNRARQQNLMQMKLEIENFTPKCNHIAPRELDHEVNHKL